MFVVLLFAAGYFAYQRFLRPEHLACAKLASLCAQTDEDVETCEAMLAKLNKSASAERAIEFGQCMLGAESCIGGSACFAKTGISVAGDAVGDFFKKLVK